MQISQILNSIFAICLGSSIPLFFPFQKKMSGYTELSKLLHILILDNYNIGLKLFSREVKKYSKNISNKNCFVIVSELVLTWFNVVSTALRHCFWCPKALFLLP